MTSVRLSTLLRRLHREMRARILEDLRDAGYGDITAAHVYVFQTPGPDGARPGELADRTLMTKQAMNHLLAGLEGRGYLERIPSEADGRARIVRLTADGHRLTETIQRSADRVERDWSQRLGAARMRTLLTALRELDDLEVNTVDR